MHETGVFVSGSTAFSEKDLGKDTVIYLNLINELSDSRWTAFYSALKVTAEIVDELRSLPKANQEPLQSGIDHYHIRDSDPIDASENVDYDFE